MNLRTKFHVASACLILTVVVGVMTSLYLSEKKRLWSEIRTQQRQDLDKLERVCDESVIAANELILINYAKTLILSPKVSYAGYVDQQGTGWIYTKTQQALTFLDNRDSHLQEIITSNRLLDRDIVMDGERVMELSKPVNERGFVRLGYSTDEAQRIFQQNLNQVFKRLLVVGFVTLLFGLLLAHLFSTALSRPIVQLMNAADAIAKGEKGVKIPEGGSDEMGHLTRTFNHMSEELAKLDHLKDDFMSHVTHELRSPLTSIIATVELMSEMPLASKDPKFRRSIDRLIFGSERLNRLVDNILDLTRMEAGKMTFDIQPVNIGTILVEMADFFEPRAMEKSLKIRAVVPAALPLAMADPERIRQAISNLVHNAIKFTNKGGIVLWAKEADGWIQVGVQDTGVGIPNDKLNTVFEKFECLKDTRDRVEKPVPGSGLGLNIVKNSIKAQGGRIWVESEVDKGSTFVFTLPLASPSNGVMQVVESSNVAEAMAVPPESNSPRQPVLLDNKKAAM